MNDMATQSSMLMEALSFVAMWGVMMVAMMLPSAMPMILLYRTVGRRLGGSTAMLPVVMFAAVYLLIWAMIGIPVYALQRVAAHMQLRSPYIIAACLAAAGAYQFSSLKRACLRNCESPLNFLMRRWKAGYSSTLSIAVRHASYCVGCCWALMMILIVAGAMSLPWVIAIALIVAAEKVLPYSRITTKVVGGVLLLLAIAVGIKPELANLLRG